MKDNVWFVPRGTQDLISPYESSSESTLIQSAQPFTVSLISTVIAEDLDGILRGDNDVLIMTRSSLGAQPLVERIHFYEEEIPKGFPITNMLADTVFISDDYNGIDRLWLEFVVLEIDTDTGERQAVTQSFRALAETAGAIFPSIIPYAFAASAVIGFAEKLISVLESDEHVVKVPFALYPKDPRPGKAVMQEGSYVIFAKPQSPTNYKLQPNGTLTFGKRPSPISYVIFDVSATNQPSPKYIISQKVATLLTQMKQGNTSTALSTIDFLNETLTQYDNFKKLERYQELKEKGTLTNIEKTLMDKIASIGALKPFIPK